MDPQTPKNKRKHPAGLTPSLSLGAFGPSPSAFRFVSPGNMNFLSSLSPHKLFNRFCGSNALETNETHEIDGFLAPSSMHNMPSSTKKARVSVSHGSNETFHDAMLAPFEASRPSQGSYNESAPESIGTADSVDIWSFANDSHSLSMNLTSITEDTVEKDVFFSPHEMFLEKSPLDSELSVSQTYETPQSTSQGKSQPISGGKGFISGAPVSPNSKLASRAGVLQSPERKDSSASSCDPKDSKKVWSKRLDDELMRCYQKFIALRDSQEVDDGVFHGTTQSKVLSRMLDKKTGVFRTPKQVSGRLSKLMRDARLQSPANPAAESTPLKATQKSSPRHSSEVKPMGIEPMITLESLDISFRYKDKDEKPHVFTRLAEKGPTSHSFHSPESVRKKLPQRNSQLLKDFDSVFPELQKQKIPMHHVTSEMNLESASCTGPSAASPHTGLRLYNTENGTFASYLTMMLRPDSDSDSYVQLKSCISVYKNGDQKLFSSEEHISGYRCGDKGIRLDVPFLRLFWAGYLTFLVNGSNNYDDLQHLTISQMIYDDSGTKRIIIGYLIYRFNASECAKTQVEVLNLSNNEDKVSNEVDELETILASSPIQSSPFKCSPNKKDLRIQTQFLNTFSPGPHTAPTFNSGVLHENNVNYKFTNTSTNTAAGNRPIIPVSKSTKDFNFEQRPQTATMLHAKYASSQDVRHYSAGQIGSFTQGPSQAARFGNNFSNQAPVQMPVTQPPYMSPHTGQMPSQVSSQPMYPGPQMPFQAQPQFVNHSQSSPQANYAYHQPINPGPGPWPLPPNNYTPQEVNSAPASQLHFFPQNEPAKSGTAKKARQPGPPLQYSTILQYDPARSVAPQIKRANSQKNFRMFSAKPPSPYKAEDKK